MFKFIKRHVPGVPGHDVYITVKEDIDGMKAGSSWALSNVKAHCMWKNLRTEVIDQHGIESILQLLKECESNPTTSDRKRFKDDAVFTLYQLVSCSDSRSRNIFLQNHGEGILSDHLWDNEADHVVWALLALRHCCDKLDYIFRRQPVINTLVRLIRENTHRDYALKLLHEAATVYIKGLIEANAIDVLENLSSSSTDAQEILTLCRPALEKHQEEQEKRAREQKIKSDREAQAKRERDEKLKRDREEQVKRDREVQAKRDREAQAKRDREAQEQKDREKQKQEQLKIEQKERERRAIEDRQKREREEQAKALETKQRQEREELERRERNERDKRAHISSLSNSNMDTRKRSLEFLLELTTRDAESKNLIREEGGISPLLRLLSDPNVDIKRNAVRLLKNLIEHNTINEIALVDNAAVVALEVFIRSESNTEIKQLAQRMLVRCQQIDAERKAKELAEREQQKHAELNQRLSRLVAQSKNASDTVLRDLNQQFMQLEPQAAALKSEDFYLARGQFYENSIAKINNAVQKETLQHKALDDYRRALHINPFSEAGNKITRIESTQKSGQPSRTGLFSVPNYANSSANTPISTDDRAEIEKLKNEMRNKK